MPAPLGAPHRPAEPSDWDDEEPTVLRYVERPDPLDEAPPSWDDEPTLARHVDRSGLGGPSRPAAPLPAAGSLASPSPKPAAGMPASARLTGAGSSSPPPKPSSRPPPPSSRPAAVGGPPAPASVQPQLVSSALRDDEIPQFKPKGPGRRVLLVLLLLVGGGAGVYFARGYLSLTWLQQRLPFLAAEAPALSAVAAPSASQAAPPASASASAAPAEKSPPEKRNTISEKNQPTEPCDQLTKDEPALPTPKKGGPTPTWQSIRGTQLLHAGAYQKALRLYCASLAVHPEHEGLQLGYLQTLLQLRDAKAAVEHGEKYVKQHPKSYRMHIALGDAYAQLGEWDHAKRSWLASVRSDPSDTEATGRFVGQQLNLAREALREQRSESAMRGFRRAAVLDKSNVEASTGVAQALLRMKKYALAVPWARRALDARPRAMGQHVLLGRAMAAAGDLDAAIEVLENALKINPGEAETLRLVGELKLRRKKK